MYLVRSPSTSDLARAGLGRGRLSPRRPSTPTAAPFPSREVAKRWKHEKTIRWGGAGDPRTHGRTVISLGKTIRWGGAGDPRSHGRTVVSLGDPATLLYHPRHWAALGRFSPSLRRPRRCETGENVTKDWRSMKSRWLTSDARANALLLWYDGALGLVGRACLWAA